MQNKLVSDEQSKVIEPQCMALLLYFLQSNKAVITRNEILDAVWPDVVINENTLTRTVAMLRKALEDNSKKPTYIVTHLKKGYQFVADVSYESQKETISANAEIVRRKPSYSFSSKYFKTFNKALFSGVILRGPQSGNKSPRGSLTALQQQGQLSRRA